METSENHTWTHITDIFMIYLLSNLSPIFLNSQKLYLKNERKQKETLAWEEGKWKGTELWWRADWLLKGKVRDDTEGTWIWQADKRHKLWRHCWGRLGCADRDLSPGFVALEKSLWPKGQLGFQDMIAPLSTRALLELKVTADFGQWLASSRHPFQVAKASSWMSQQISHLGVLSIRRNCLTVWTILTLKKITPWTESSLWAQCGAPNSGKRKLKFTVGPVHLKCEVVQLFLHLLSPHYYCEACFATLSFMRQPAGVRGGWHWAGLHRWKVMN